MTSMANFPFADDTPGMYRERMALLCHHQWQPIPVRRFHERGHFLLIAGAVYYFVILSVNAFMARVKKELPVDPTTKKCSECKSEIAIDAKRCAFCTSQLA